MSAKQVTVLMLAGLFFATLIGCGRYVGHSSDVPGGIVEARLVRADEVAANQEVTGEIMPVLDAIFWGGIEQRRGLLHYLSVGCTSADGLGGPPKCAPDEAEGTLVEVFPVGSAEGHFVRPEDIDRTLEFSVDWLYAVYRPRPGVDPVTYWPVGEYALLFERRVYNTSQPITVFVQEGKIVRVAFSQPVNLEAVLNEVRLEDILISPEEASALTEQVKAPR